MFSKTAMYIYLTVIGVLIILTAKTLIGCRNYVGENGVNACSNIIAFSPSDSLKTFALKKRAQKYQGINKSKEAYADYTALIQLCGKSGQELSANDIPVVYEQTALLAHKLQKLDAAFKYSDMAIRGGVESAEIYKVRAEENFRRTNYARAAGDYEKLMDLGLKTISIQFNLGRSYMRLEKYKFAGAQFKNIEMKMKDDFDFNMVKGFLHYKLRQYDTALRYYKAALRLNPASAVCKKSIKRTEMKILDRFKKKKSGLFY
ncbi:MAG: tetratricopeptide repeat protein [Elusimicrobiota bacterium]|nr:tetratricopeptide repeat protein [Elusimicrobiota bacterium]